jgi:hypothetical protein
VRRIGFQVYKLFGQFHEPGIGVVAGGLASHQIRGHFKALGAFYAPGVPEAAFTGDLYYQVAVQPVRIRHAPDRRVKNTLQVDFILRQFVSDCFRVQRFQAGVRQAVYRNLMPPVQVRQILYVQPFYQQVISFPAARAALNSAVQIEGGFQVIPVQNFQQLSVLLNPVIITQGHRF